MSKARPARSRLGFLLSFYAALFIAVALCAFFVLRALAYDFLSKRIDSEEYQFHQTTAAFLSLQLYVAKHDLSKGEASQLDAWRTTAHDGWYVVYDGDLLLYDSLHSFTLADFDPNVFTNENTHTLHFSDGDAQVLFTFYFGTQWYRFADGLCFALAFLLFLALFLARIRKKVRYITLLEQEMRILEGGDLSYAITVEGRDELSDLGRSIDDMRRSVIARQEGEDRARRANEELITAMSHDLRTPLTSLIGYLELMKSGRYPDAEQSAHFISSSLEKAYRIKEMSDNLFSYFMVFSKNWEDEQTELVDMQAILSQALCEHIFELESRGFTVEQDMPQVCGRLRIAPALLPRVFDNLFCNILRYGDTSVPVRVAYACGERLCITISNGTPAQARASGAGIGLKTCRMILSFHQGALHTEEAAGRFTARIFLPIA